MLTTFPDTWHRFLRRIRQKKSTAILCDICPCAALSIQFMIAPAQAVQLTKSRRNKIGSQPLCSLDFDL
jgi:hypothetical protein